MDPTNGESSRIKYLAVKNLFNTFDYHIPLKLEQNITILHGPNGFGKTALLRMIDGLFNAKYQVFRTLPFTRFEVGLNGEREVIVEKATTSAKRRRESLGIKIRLREKRKVSEEFILAPSEYDENRLPIPASLIDEIVPELARVGQRQWRDLRTGELLSVQDVIDNYAVLLPIDFVSARTPEWLKTIRESLHVMFITTERLIRSRRSSSPGYRYDKPTKSISALSVIEYSKELADKMQATLAQSVELSSRLDSSFPMRLMEQIDRKILDSLSEDAIRDHLRTLENKRQRLMAAGLLDKGQQGPEIPGGSVDEFARKVLTIYIEDTQKKLQVFDSILEKLELFKNIISELFSYKSLTISKQEGFCFESLSQERLDLQALSSGEQHELVLLYQLLFQVQPNSIILIDEPEISLHIAWQRQFLQNLARITKLTFFDVLIATHSPQIIHDRWDLTVELKGPECQ